MRNMESNNNISVAPSGNHDFDYIVTVKNVLDIGYDPSVKAVRDEAALKMVRSQCQTARVVGETSMQTGTWMGGRPAISYFVQVDC